MWRPAPPPVLKINGAVQAGGGASDPEIQMGRTHQLKIIFKNPDQTLGSAVMEKIAETVEKSVIVGNSEGIGISTDRVAPPETRPNQDTSTTSPAASQKLYRTALNYLYRLESSHDELARIFGARFTNTATRAVVFNGIDVNYQSGEPYSFSWKGLRIDSSSAVNYYSHFSENPNLHQKEFMYVFGLQASQDEADIFENDFQVASISTVKGLKLINQNQIPGVQVRKISSSNLSDLESLNISDATKTKLRDSVHAGHIVYVPSQPFTYQNWTGLVYIDIDPSTGFGGYTIGEGLNGGYTVEQWPEGWQHFWRDHLISNLTATIQSPTANQEFIRGVKIPWRAYYRGDTSVPGLPNEWYDVVNLDTSSWTVGTTTLWSGYGTTASVQIRIKSDCKIGKENCDYDDFILKQATSTRYGMPPGILKAIIEQETKSNPFNPRTSRYEPKRDFQDFSGSTPNVAMTSTVPYSYFTLSGQNSSGQAVATGSKVYSLPRDYKTTLKNTQSGGWQLRGIITTDRNGDGILTFQEVYENDRDHTPGSQNWPTSTIPSLNFTPQFLLSSSYGLGHVMYKEATEAKNPSNNLIMKTTYTPHDIVNKPELGIELAASILKGKFDHLVPNDNCNGWSQAVRN
ncbi:MAG: hypothetical protein HY093_03145 [Candidatus Liptonbacteria bacterium]|nr:hypothetical protein [Candidatus Liptonbacteria bacterium]